MLKIAPVIFLILLNASQYFSYVYKLEDDLHSSFNIESEVNLCDDLANWVLDKDEEKYVFYLRPLEVLSCVTFTFNIFPQGYLEIKFDIESVASSDEVTVIVYEEKSSKEFPVVTKNAILSETQKCNGSHTVKLSISSNYKKGYVCALL